MSNTYDSEDVGPMGERRNPSIGSSVTINPKADQGKYHEQEVPAQEDDPLLPKPSEETPSYNVTWQRDEDFDGLSWWHKPSVSSPSLYQSCS